MVQPPKGPGNHSFLVAHYSRPIPGRGRGLPWMKSCCDDGEIRLFAQQFAPHLCPAPAPTSDGDTRSKNHHRGKIQYNIMTIL